MWRFACIQIVLFVAFVWSASVVGGGYSCVCYEGGEGVYIFCVQLFAVEHDAPHHGCFLLLGGGGTIAI